MENKELTVETVLTNARLPDESFEGYRNRRRHVNKTINNYLRLGVQFWDSMQLGTYRKPKTDV